MVDSGKETHSLFVALAKNSSDGLLVREWTRIWGIRGGILLYPIKQKLVKIHRKSCIDLGVIKSRHLSFYRVLLVS